VEVLNEEDEVVDLAKEEEEERLPRIGFGLDFPSDLGFGR
jgi:hypothetical protein